MNYPALLREEKTNSKYSPRSSSGHTSILGYNYQSGEWYDRSYAILNKNYKSKKLKKEGKEDGLLRRKIKGLFE